MADILPVSLPPGTRLGEYKLLKATGQGGFGITYTAWDTRLNRRVAIKECMPAGLCYRDYETGKIHPISDTACADYHQAMADMHREARTLASLSHAAIVGVFDVFESQGSLFYVMPWLDGGSLRERAQRMWAHPADTDAAEVQRWLDRLLDGLAYLHDKGIIHRDIKPDNILFDDNGDPVIIDFGAALNRAARTTTSDTTQGEFSPAYGSPEQLTGKGKVGPWTDLFSLAAVFYELIAGERPEPADHRLMEESLKPLQHFPAAAAYPAPLLAAIMRNLSLAPQARCADSAAWQRMLHTPAPLSFLRLHRRHILLAAAGLLIAASGAAGAGFFSRAPQPPPAPQPPQSASTTTSPQELVNTRQQLDRKVREYFHVPELIKRCDEFAARRDAFFAQKKQEYERESEKFLASLDSYADYGDAMDALRKKDKELKAEWDKWQKEFERQYSAEVSSKIPANDTMKDTYPAATSDEILLLPSVCDRISQDCSQKFTESSFYYKNFYFNSTWMINVECDVNKHFNGEE